MAVRDWKSVALQCAKNINSERKPLEQCILELETEMQSLKDYSAIFKGNQFVLLNSLDVGTYDILAMKEYYTRKFMPGRRILLILDLDGSGDLAACFRYDFIDHIHDVLPRREFARMADKKNKFVFCKGRPIACLHVIDKPKDGKQMGQWKVTIAPDAEKHCVRSQINDVLVEIGKMNELLTKIPTIEDQRRSVSQRWGAVVDYKKAVLLLRRRDRQSR